MIRAALLYFQPLRNGYLHILWMLLSGCIYAKKGTHRIFWEIKANNVCPLGSSFTSTLKIEMGRAVGRDLVQNLACGPGLFFVSQNNLMQQKKMAKLAFYQNNLSLDSSWPKQKFHILWQYPAWEKNWPDPPLFKNALPRVIPFHHKTAQCSKNKILQKKCL